MIHQFQDKNQIIRKKKIIWTLIVLGLLLFLAFSGVLVFFSKTSNYIGQPIWKAKNTIVNNSKSLSYLTRTRSSLSKENQKLLKENSNLETSMIDYQFLKNENNNLKKLLSRISNPRNFILSGILSKPSDSPYDTMIIDVGSNKGILKGLKVYINGNIPIGIINKVYSQTSLVELYSNPGMITSGIINKLNIKIKLVGRGGGNFETSIPAGLSIPKGSLVTLPGLDGGVIAITEEEITDTLDPNKKLILKAPVNIQNEEWVEVSKKK